MSDPAVVTVRPGGACASRWPTRTARKHCCCAPPTRFTPWLGFPCTFQRCVPLPVVSEILAHAPFVSVCSDQRQVAFELAALAAQEAAYRFSADDDVEAEANRVRDADAILTIRSIKNECAFFAHAGAVVPRLPVPPHPFSVSPWMPSHHIARHGFST